MNYFSATYKHSRDKFHNACSRLGLRCDSFAHPHARGSEGEILTIDAALCGKPGAPALLIVLSGTHGVEGFSGAAAQLAWLDAHVQSRVREVAVLLVHAVNPFGFSHASLTDSENIDINRNFVIGPRPENRLYRALVPQLLPAAWTPESFPTLLHAVDTMAEAQGLSFQQTMRRAIYVGQSEFPRGLFYAGNCLAWSSLVLKHIVAKYAATSRQLACIDLHSGVGRRGFGELIFANSPDPNGVARAMSWYRTTPSDGGEADASDIEGRLLYALAATWGRNPATNLVLEFGVMTGDALLPIMLADNWLRSQERPVKEQARPIKECMREAFCPDDFAWQERVIAAALRRIDQALVNLSDSP